MDDETKEKSGIPTAEGLLLSQGAVLLGWLYWWKGGVWALAVQSGCVTGLGLGRTRDN